MRELTKVVLGVAASELFLWSVGGWSWVSYSLRRWPSFLERYAVIFPAVLLILLLVVRRWRPARSHLIPAGLSGAVAGLLASELSRVLAYMITAHDRSVLWNSWRLASAADLLIIESLFAFFLTLSWLYGATAAMLVLLADRVERKYFHPSEQAGAAAG